MRIEPFELERWQSIHEHEVELNLSDSGMHPLRLSELVEDGAAVDELLDQGLIYTQTNGTPALRERIAALYPGATAAHVEVTTGGAEANLIAAWSLVEPGDEVVVMTPNYMQIWGLVRCVGAETREWPMQPDFAGRRWGFDTEVLNELVNKKTKLIALCNPNNPTGATLTADELDRISAIAARNGAWILADEIYQSSELAPGLSTGETPTAWGRYERVVVTNSLSKAYGLPGLRLGWIVAPPEEIQRFWELHDYTSIAPAALSDHLAVKVLAPDRRARLLERTRAHLKANYAVCAEWVEANSAFVRHIPPRAGAMLFVKYEHPIDSIELAERFLREKSLLLVPGSHYGMDRWLRIGFGGEKEKLQRGLERVTELFESLS